MSACVDMEILGGRRYPSKAAQEEIGMISGGLRLCREFTACKKGHQAPLLVAVKADQKAGHNALERSLRRSGARGV